MMRSERRGPFGLPISRQTYAVAVGAGVVGWLVTIGAVYQVTTATVIGKLSLAEAIATVLVAVYLLGVIGPLSPFRVSGGAP